MTYFANIQTSYADSPNLDASGKLRISDNNCIFSSKMQYDNQPLIWNDVQRSGSGTSSTYNSNQACVTMSVTASTAGKRARKTYQAFNYQAGKSQLVYMSGTFGSAGSGITKNIGLFDDFNGLIFRQTTVMNVVVRTFTSGSQVDTVVAQSSWNVDKLDGTGASGLNVDFTKAQVFVIDFEWLGVGRIRFGILIDGKIYYCHYVSNFNGASIPWMGIPSLPITYDIENSGAGGSASLIQISSSIVAEGNNNPLGYIRSVNRGSSTIVPPPTDYIPLISLRLQSGKTGASAIPLNASIICSTSSLSLVQLFLNPTIAGVDAASWNPVGTSSSFEYDINRTSANTLTGGNILYSLYIGGDVQFINLEQINSIIRLGVSLSGVADELVLGIRQISAATNYNASLTFNELV